MVEARAAAAFVLACSPSSRDEMRRDVKPSLPPLVLAMIRLSPEGASLVSDTLLDEIAWFLQPLERAQLRAATQEPARRNA
jgi:hypothetical protein